MSIVFLKAVKARMVLCGVRVGDVAAGTGIPRHRLYRKIRGESEFRRDEMVKIAEYLGTTPGELFFP